jgi:hypothetical protein
VYTTVNMTSALLAVLLGLAASVTAQAVNQTGPFYLRIAGKEDESTLDGYTTSCHTGAALEALCYTQGQLPEEGSFNSAEYWFNSSWSSPLGPDGIGILVWKLPVVINETDTLVEESLSFQYQVNSNVAAPQIFFPESSGSQSVGFDENGELFVAAWYDDSLNEPGVRPPSGSDPLALYNWHVCWQVLGGGYYYQALGWAQSLPPSNPTCEAVRVTRVEP